MFSKRFAFRCEKYVVSLLALTRMARKYCTTAVFSALLFSAHVQVVGAELGKADRHVVVVVWDGMRPDFVTSENTPNLWKVATDGVIFNNHHSVYPSATNVNGTALITGVYPGRNGIIANHVYRPDINPREAIDVEIPSSVNKGDELSGGKYVSVPTLAELVQHAGGRSIIATAKIVGLLLDRGVQRKNPQDSV